MYTKFHDEDGPVGQYVRENFFPDYDYKGTVIEVGGGYPEYYSFSKHYIQNGWRGIIFEPNPVYVAMHKEANNEVYDVAVSSNDIDEVDFYRWGKSSGNHLSFSALEVRAASSDDELKRVIDDCEIIKVKTITLNTFFKEHNLNYVDIISVDTEGWEVEVMQGFDHMLYSAKIIILENLFHEERYTEIMSSKGYKLVNKLSINYIYENMNL